MALLDEWAARFFEELDYVREGENATKFAEQMKDDLPQASDMLPHNSWVYKGFTTLQFTLPPALDGFDAATEGRALHLRLTCMRLSTGQSANHLLKIYLKARAHNGVAGGREVKPKHGRRCGEPRQRRSDMLSQTGAPPLLRV